MKEGTTHQCLVQIFCLHSRFLTRMFVYICVCFIPSPPLNMTNLGVPSHRWASTEVTEAEVRAQPTPCGHVTTHDKRTRNRPHKHTERHLFFEITDDWTGWKETRCNLMLFMVFILRCFPVELGKGKGWPLKDVSAEVTVSKNSFSQISKC